MFQLHHLLDVIQIQRQEKKSRMMKRKCVTVLTKNKNKKRVWDL
jgi:hypothetical protein